MARIRHVAFYTADPEKEANFYCQAFDMKRVRKAENGSVWISDGYINVALIKRDISTGLNHIGFLVDDLQSAQKRLRDVAPGVEFEAPHDLVTAAEFKLKDPDGNELDVSERGWVV